MYCIVLYYSVSTYVSTAHIAQDRGLVLILSCQTNSIHNTRILETIRLYIGKPWIGQGTEVMLTYCWYQVPSGQ